MLSTMHLYPIDGAVHDVGANDTAFSYRDTQFAEVIFGVDPDPANAAAMRDWCVGYWDADADPAVAIEPLRKVGVYRVAMTVLAARDLILERDSEIGDKLVPESKTHAEALAITG